ncbi:MAG: formimidoylglutamate deiminase [Pyrinomonadaceae bacterium]
MPFDPERRTAWLPDLLYDGTHFDRDRTFVTDERAGHLSEIGFPDIPAAPRAVRLKNRALFPGLVNAHSHAFQRVIRGRTEFRSSERDTFWTWREMMYSAAERLTPEDVYDASRMAFLEMALSGITTVGEFHYLHHNPDGTPYDDPNLLAKQVILAASDVGIRIALLRTAYARPGFDAEPNPRQSRFITRDAGEFIEHTEELRAELARGEQAYAKQVRGDAPPPPGLTPRGGRLARERVPLAWVGVAPHSVRAVPLEYLREVAAYARARKRVVHMHVAEQPAEVEACRAEYGRTPVALLSEEGLLDERFTAVHAIHVTTGEAHLLGSSRAHACACPTTERNLGDGVVPADLFFDRGVRVALGTDSHAQIDLLEDARELELNLRLAKLSRAVLPPAASDNPSIKPPPRPSSLAARLFECATASGATSVGGRALERARPGDFFTVALDDPSIAGAGDDDLLAAVVFSSARAAVREVCVGGRLIVENGRHFAQEEIVARFSALQRKLWG